MPEERLTWHDSPRVPIALGSGSERTADGRSFFQSRLKLYGGWVFVISGGFLVVGMTLRSAIETAPFTAPFWTPSLFHLLGTLAAGSIWLAVRGRSFSPTGLQWIDAVGVTFMCLCFALMAGSLALSGLPVIEGPFHGLSA